MDLPSSASAREPRNDSFASIDDLDEAIQQLACHVNAVSYRMLLLVREFDDRLGWAKWSFSGCAEWLQWRIGIGFSAAREKVRVAHALRNLPAIAAAFEQGALSYSKVRALTRAADAINEQALLEFALGTDAATVEERCRQIRNVHPDSAQEAARAWARRYLSVSRNPGRHTLVMSVELPLEEGEVVVRALDKAVRSGGFASGPECGGEGWHAQQADALVAMAKSYLLDGGAGEWVADGRTGESVSRGGTGESGSDGETGESAPGRGAGESVPGRGAGESVGASAGASKGHRGSVSADHYQVVIHVDEAALRGGAGLSEMPIETVRRLACDCSLTVVTEDEHGAPLNVGRKQRIVPTALRRALWSRDRGCTFPGCHNKRFVDAHHLLHWINGGETSDANTALLCTRHHRLVHEGVFKMRKLDDGTFEFRRPDGRVIPRCGYRAEDAAPDPAVLEAFDYPSADAWLAALLARGARPRKGHRQSACH